MLVSESQPLIFETRKLVELMRARNGRLWNHRGDWQNLNIEHVASGNRSAPEN